MFANGIGVGLFQVAYFDIVTGTLPRGDRGVAGSLAMVTRTLGIVAGATLLMLAFQGIGDVAALAGADPTDAFLERIRGAFRIAAAIPLAAGVVRCRAQSMAACARLLTRSSRAECHGSG